MIVVTGGAGFIGSAFVAKLNALGRTDILVVDALDKSNKWKNLVGLQFLDYQDKDEFLASTVSNSAYQKIQAIVHLGACSSTTETDAKFMLENNYKYSRHMAEFALSRNIRFIYASSAATYGDGAHGFSDDDAASLKLEPLNVYAYSKQLFDRWVLQNGLESRFVGIKFFNVFGPNEYHKGDMRSVVFKAFHQIRETGKVQLFRSMHPLFKDGEQKRDFIYVKDCVEVMHWLLENTKVAGIFNLGTGTAKSWNDLVQAIFKALGLPPAIDYIPMPESLASKYQYFTEARMEKLAQAGYKLPWTPLEDSVQDYVQNYLLKGPSYL